MTELNRDDVLDLEELTSKIHSSINEILEFQKADISISCLMSVFMKSMLGNVHTEQEFLFLQKLINFLMNKILVDRF